MLRIVFITLLAILFTTPTFAEDVSNEKTIKETYKLQGTIEYDDNPVETIYLDENIERPQVNIPKRSLTLPVGVLNIMTNTNSQRSALARAVINRNALADILPLTGSVTEQMGGFSWGQTWNQELTEFAQIQNATSFFIRYDTPQRFSFTTAVRQATNSDIGTQYNTLRLSPEWHITDRLTLKDTFSNYMNQTRNKNELTLVYTPALKKYAESLKFELGVAQSYYQSGRRSSAVSFTTDFKL